MKKIIEHQNGVMIVEATLVFPIMFFVIFLMLYMGNVFYQDAKLSSLVAEASVKGAAYCADPLLDNIETSGRVPKENSDIQPYRYLFGVSAIESKIEKYVEERFSKRSDGFFGGMSPRNVKCTAKFNNSIIMYSFTVEATYEIRVPLRFMGTEPPIIVSFSEKATAPVNDNGEFINNLNMAVDYYQASGIKISNEINKIKEFFGKFGK